MRRFLILSLVAISGCATQAKFAEHMDTWVGATEAQLVGNFGPPQSSYVVSDGSKVIGYTRNSTMQMGGGTVMQPVTTHSTATVYGGYGGPVYGNGSSTTYVPVQQPAYNIELTCSLQFMISKDGRVTSWSSSGNYCVAN